MAVFEALGKKITKTGQDAVTKTKIAAETLKANNRISESERAISGYCDLIGRAYYVKYASGGWDPEFDEMFIGIENEKEKIEEAKMQLRVLRGVVECSGCGRELQLGTNFCSHCGTKLTVPEKPEKTADSEEENDEPEQPDEAAAEESAGTEKEPETEPGQ